MTAMPRAYLPPGLNAQRDRGGGLFITREAVQSPWFACERAGEVWRLWPTAALVAQYERAEAPDALARTFLRFRGLPIEAESLALFCEGTKLAEAPEKARIAALNKAVRQRAAVCMRLGGGGGLFACAILLNLIGGNRR